MVLNMPENSYFAANWHPSLFFPYNFFFEGSSVQPSSKFDYDMPLHGRIQKNVFRSNIQKNVFSGVIDA
jgi:hypothetical protein